MKLDLRREKSDFLVNEVDPISKACQEYVKTEQEIADLEALVKLKKEVLRQNNETIVTLMEERGVKSIKMSDGNSVDIKPFYTGSISEATHFIESTGFIPQFTGQVEMISTIVNPRFSS